MTETTAPLLSKAALGRTPELYRPTLCQEVNKVSESTDHQSNRVLNSEHRHSPFTVHRCARVGVFTELPFYSPYSKDAE